VSRKVGAYQIVHDKGMSTYVPVNQVCASACSFIFFGGSGRVAHGQLGVHQFYSKVERGQASESLAQYTTAEIIGFLNEFDTPPNVYEKMFSTKSMYYFTEIEKLSFTKDKRPTFAKKIAEISLLIGYLNAYIDGKLTSDLLEEMPLKLKVALTQYQLRRIGCFDGNIDGLEGDAMLKGLYHFNSTYNQLGKAEYKSDFVKQFKLLSEADVGACYLN